MTDKLTPLQRLDREISLYVRLIDARRARGADCIDHVAHLELLYLQRSVMTGVHSTQDELDDVTALLDAVYPPVPDAQQALTEELEGNVHPTRHAGVLPLQPEQLDIVGQGLVRKFRFCRLRRWLVRVVDAWSVLRPPEDPRRTYERAGLGHWLP